MEYSKPKVAAAYPGPKHQEVVESVQSYNLDQAYQVIHYESFISLALVRFRDSSTPRKARAISLWMLTVMLFSICTATSQTFPSVTITSLMST